MTVRLRIPERFELAGREWTVRRMEVVDPGDPEADGWCHPRERTIDVTTRLDGDRALETFAHEVLHAGLFRLEMSSALEERLCSTLEPVLLDFLRAVVEEG